MSATKTLPMRLAPTAAARLRRRRRAAHEPAEDQDAAIDLRSPALVAAGPVSIAGSPSLARSLGPNAVLALQRTHGNRHVQRLLSRQEIKRCGTDAACRCAACSGQDERAPVTSQVAPRRVQRQSGGQPLLRLGSKSPSVATLQQKLGIAADGIFGPATHKAVVAFQQGAGLTADGIVGPQTWSSLGAGATVAQPTGAGGPAGAEAAAVGAVVAKLGAVKMALQALKTQSGDTTGGGAVAPGTAAPTAQPELRPGWLDDAAEWAGDTAEAADEWVGDKAEAASEWANEQVDSATDWATEQAKSAGEWVEEQAGAAGEWVGEQAGAAADWVGEQAGAASEWVSEQVGAAGAAVGSAVEAATEVASGVWDEAQSLSEDLRQRYAKELEVLNEVVGSMGKPGFITSFPLILSALDDLLGKLGKGALGANLGVEAEPLQTPPTNTKSYTKITPKSGSYTVSGTLSEVGEKLAARGHAGSVQPKYTKTYTEIDTGTEKVVLAQIELDLTKTMPKWAEYDKQCAPIKAEWDRVYAELDAHENKHMADDNRIFANLHTKLIGLSNEKAGERIDAATDESDQASDAFHATDAGSKQPTVKHVTCGGLEKVP